MRSMMFRGVLALALILGSSTSALAATGWLGIVTQPTDADLRQGLDLTRDGLLVNMVAPGSPAATAGFKKGDVLLGLDGKAVSDPSELRDRVRAMAPGRTLRAEVWRDGAARTINVTLGELPADADAAPPAGDAPHMRVQVNGRELSGEELERFLSDPSRLGGLDLRELHERLMPPGEDDDAPRVKVYRSEDSVQTRERRIRVEVKRDRDDDSDAIEDAPTGRGRLGVRIEPLTADMATALGAVNTKGVLVLEVMAETPASRAGFKAGDIVTRVGTTAVTSPEALVQALADVEGKVSIQVMRKGLRRDLVTELASRAAPRISSNDRDEREVRVEVRPRRRGGERENREPAPRVRVYEMRTKDGHSEDGADLRDEVDQLKHELRELRRRLDVKK